MPAIPPRSEARRAVQTRDPGTAFRPRRILLAALALVVACAATAGAQRRAPAADSVQRAALEQRVRVRLATVLRQRLALTDQQMQRLEPVRARVEGRRRALLQQERDARLLLRRELGRGDSADQARVAQQLDRLTTVQRQRAELLQQEQRELAAFLTPVQRARYHALQETLRRQVQAWAARRRNGRPSPPPGAARPPADPVQLERPAPVR